MKFLEELDLEEGKTLTMDCQYVGQESLQRLGWTM